MAAKKKVTKKSTTKRPVGRPTKYKPEFCEHLITHLARGLSYEIFGACLPDYDKALTPVACSTIYLWEKNYPEFSEAKKAGWELCQAFYEKQGVQFLTHRRDGEQLNSTVWIFQMKNRFGWKDKKEVGLDEETKATVKLAYSLDEADDA